MTNALPMSRGGGTTHFAETYCGEDDGHNGIENTDFVCVCSDPNVARRGFDGLTLPT